MWFKNNKNNTLKIIENKDNSKNKTKIKKSNNTKVESKIDNSVSNLNFNFHLNNFEMTDEQKDLIIKKVEEINENILNGKMPLDTSKKYAELLMESIISGRDFDEAKKISDIHLGISGNEKINKTQRELITDKLINAIKDNEKWKEEIIIESYNNFFKSDVTKSHTNKFLRVIKLFDEIESEEEFKLVIIPYLQIQALKWIMINNKEISNKKFDVINDPIFERQKSLFQNNDKSKYLIITTTNVAILKRVGLFSFVENSYNHFTDSKDINGDLLNAVISGSALEMISVLQTVEKFEVELKKLYNILKNSDYIQKK